MTQYALPAMATTRYALDGGGQHDLAAQVAAGDREAFVQVYRAHFAEVRAFAERVLGSRASAEDVVHEVFLALPKALRTFRGECSLRSYVLSIAVRTARTHHRSVMRRAKREEQAAAAPPCSVPSPEECAEQRELALLLNRALGSLPVDQRIAFVLCEVEERTSAEVAEITGEKASTIRGRVLLAKRKLREQLNTFAETETSASRPGSVR